MIEYVYGGAKVFLGNYEYVLNNVFMFDWESDLFGISKSGYAVEIEVKISRGDFFQDFKKPKHQIFIDRASTDIPNKFFFACPDGLIKIEEVPEYAGLIYTGQSYSRFSVIKPAPFIHREKIDFTSRLLSKYYNSSLMTRSRIIDLYCKLERGQVTADQAAKELRRINRLLK